MQLSEEDLSTALLYLICIIPSQHDKHQASTCNPVPLRSRAERHPVNPIYANPPPSWREEGSARPARVHPFSPVRLYFCAPGLHYRTSDSPALPLDVCAVCCGERPGHKIRDEVHRFLTPLSLCAAARAAVEAGAEGSALQEGGEWRCGFSCFISMWEGAVGGGRGG
jgi:hypothetical protein